MKYAYLQLETRRLWTLYKKHTLSLPGITSEWTFCFIWATKINKIFTVYLLNAWIREGFFFTYFKVKSMQSTSLLIDQVLQLHNARHHTSSNFFYNICLMNLLFSCFNAFSLSILKKNVTLGERDWERCWSSNCWNMHGHSAPIRQWGRTLNHRLADPPLLNGLNFLLTIVGSFWSNILNVWPCCLRQGYQIQIKLSKPLTLKTESNILSFSH